jgi:hypothetical protein
MKIAVTLALAVVAAATALAPPALAQQGRGGRRDGGPEVGAPAPDFALARLDADGKADAKEVVRLSKLLEAARKPVLLIFGSYT